MSMRLKRIWRGVIRSWSMHASLIAVALGGLEQYQGALTSMIGAKNAGILLMVFGVLGMVLRAKTTQSLEDKGK